MSKKTVVLILLLCLVLISGCADGDMRLSESLHIGEDAAKGTIITAYIQQTDSSASVWKGWAAARLYEDTGLLLETCSAEGETTEELRLRLTSGTIPDVIGFADREQAQLYIDAGILLPLNEYRESLPSLFEGEDYQAALEWSAEGTGGELLLAPLSVGQAGEHEYRSMPMCLKSAWEKAGSPEVSTLEEYLDVIEQLRRAKPLSDIGESMYGICLWREDGGIMGHAASLACMYGIDMQTVSPLMEANMITGSISSVLEEDSFYKRAVHFYYEANRRGLLDRDSPNQTAGNVERKMNAGRVLFGVMPESAGADSILRNTEGRMAYIPLPAEDMKLYLEPDHIVGGNRYLAVNRNSDRVEDAVRLLDWFYREDTILYLYNGPEGVVWEQGEDGLPRLTETGRQILEQGQKGEDLPGYQGSLQEGIRPFGVLGRTPASLKAEEYTFSSHYWQGEEVDWADGNGQTEWDTVRGSAAIYLIDPLPSELNRTANEIEKLVYKTFWNMIYAEDEEEFQALWQSLRDESDRLGLDQVTAFYEKAWERALERAAETDEDRTAE